MKALVLQRLFNLSDRQLEEACRFDIRYKYILGLQLDDMGFDHSVFGKFRDRLLTSQKHKEALFELVKMITDTGLIKQNESQRTDSFHIIANVAVPAASELIREGIRICLRPAKEAPPRPVLSGSRKAGYHQVPGRGTGQGAKTRT
jgi:IS5 family transposase